MIKKTRLIPVRIPILDYFCTGVVVEYGSPFIAVP